MNDSQDWWYRDEPQLYTAWNAMEAPPGQEGANLMVGMEGAMAQGGYGAGAAVGGAQTVFAGAGYGMNGGGGDAGGGGFGPGNTIL